MPAVDPNQFAPYAPAENVLRVITRYRDRGLPEPINTQTLESIGIPSGNTSRTLQSLRFLKLIADDGSRTADFERLKRASSDEYTDVLGEIVRSAYSRVFDIVDPARDDIQMVHDAFRHYDPSAQRTRMVSLFLGLCREANLAPPESGRSRKPVERKQSTPRRPPIRAQDTESSTSSPETYRHPEPVVGITEDFHLVNALIRQLPSEKKWTREKRDKWMQALTATVDLLVEVEEAQK